jgi:hypothetical protein
VQRNRRLNLSFGCGSASFHDQEFGGPSGLPWNNMIADSAEKSRIERTVHCDELGVMKNDLWLSPDKSDAFRGADLEGIASF